MPQPNPLDLQRLYELSTDALIVSSADGLLLSANPAFVSSLGYVEDELIDKPMLEQLVHADDLEATRRELSKLAQGEASRMFEIRCLTKGREVRWFQWSARANPAGDRIYAIGRDAGSGGGGGCARHLRDRRQRSHRVGEQGVRRTHRVDDRGCTRTDAAHSEVGPPER
jgi:PAS domain S-box-containing protein